MTIVINYVYNVKIYIYIYIVAGYEICASMGITCNVYTYIR